MPERNDQKSNRGRPPIDTEAVNVRMARAQLEALDAWIGQQLEPRLTRPEAIRRLIAEALARQPVGQTVEAQIASAKREIARNPAEGEASPAQGMAKLRRGLAENKLRVLKVRKRGARDAGDGS